MVSIIPKVKTLEIKEGFLCKKEFFFNKGKYENRIEKALCKIPFNTDGARFEINIIGNAGEEYELWINENSVDIKASSSAGAFYAIQSLRQLLKSDNIPCLYIKDKPDFSYRGFYHDVTRGKVSNIETLKNLIDNMAYYKLNSLQLYVEHTYEFEEYKDLNEKLGYLTSDELKELDSYCKENFIDFIPSLSTFGHLYELLNQDKYKHLCVRKNFEREYNTRLARALHHTIDPLNPESIEIIKSLINQYAPNFTSDYFNICCDETFDLMEVYGEKGYDTAKIYVDFAKKIIEHVKSKEKKVMMWADILLKHPETISELPEDTCFLNWCYGENPPEEMVQKIAEFNRNQIVCPGTNTWNRFCERVEREENNICHMVEYGYKYGAQGVLTTNWGDHISPCSLELAMYGLVLGAEKSWSVNTKIDDDFYNRVNNILYGFKNGMEYLKTLSDMNNMVEWGIFFNNYYEYRYSEKPECYQVIFGDIKEMQQKYTDFANELTQNNDVNNEFIKEMLIAAEGICVISELSLKLAGQECERITDTNKWLTKYSEQWQKKNKASELYEIIKMFKYCEERIS